MENKFDKEIEDLGWEKMQALLDKEKPVVGFIPPQYIDLKSGENSSFRKRWALRALLFLSLAGGGIWSYYFFKIKPENQPAIVLNNASAVENNGQNLTQNKPPIIASEARQIIANEAHQKGGNDDLTKLSNSKNVNLENQSKPNIIIEGIENKVQTIDNQLIVKNNNTNLLTQNLDSDKEIKGIITENNGQIIDEKLTNPSIALNMINTEDKNQDKEEKFVEKKAIENAEKIGDRQFFEAINPLVLEVSIDSVASISERYPIIILKENAHKMLQKWQFGLTLGIHTEGVQHFDGYQLGLIMGKNLNRKWAFSTGINYRKAAVLSRANSSLLAATANKSNIGVSTPSASFNLSKVVEVRLKNMQYVELPIVFDRLVNKRVSISSGLKLSYLVSQNWRTIDTTNVHIYVISYGNQSNTSQAYSLNDKSFLSNLTTNSLDFAVLGGINYRISRHFDASVRYDFGLKNILKKNNASVYNRYLGLNVNYYFK